MCVPLAFSLLNQFTHNLPLEAPLIYIPSLDFRRCKPNSVHALTAVGVALITGRKVTGLEIAYY